jgi:hypothetical protein
MLEQATKPRRWLQFRIRTLLALTALCAVVCWALFDGFARLEDHFTQSNFERFAGHLKAGRTNYDDWRKTDFHAIDHAFSRLGFTDPQGHWIN